VFSKDIVKEERREIRRGSATCLKDPRYYEYMTARETLRFTARSSIYSVPGRDRAPVTEPWSWWIGRQGRPPDQGLLGRRAPAPGHRPGSGELRPTCLSLMSRPPRSTRGSDGMMLLEVMERLRKHTTIFYSTHILTMWQRVSDNRWIILNKGVLVCPGPDRGAAGLGTGSRLQTERPKEPHAGGDSLA